MRVDAAVAIHAIGACALLGFLGCAPLPLRATGIGAPRWVGNRPVSRTHFVGVGSAKIDGDLHAAQKRARTRALQDVTEQIQVTIVSDVRYCAYRGGAHGARVESETCREQIAAFSSAMISGWEETATWQDPNGFFWSRVTLRKKEYYDKINEKVTHAAGRLGDIIRNARQGSALFRITELHKGFRILDEFFGTPLYGRVDGVSTLLNHELERRMARLLERIELRPAAPRVVFTSANAAMAETGVFVFCDGEADRSLPIAWAASRPGVGFNNLPAREDGFRPVAISGVAAQAEPLVITATIDMSNITYDLIRRKFALPAGSFSAEREKPRVFIENKSGFCWALARKLERESAIAIVYRRSAADVVLRSAFIPDAPVVRDNSLYRGQGRLVIQLVSADGLAWYAEDRTIRVAGTYGGAYIREAAQNRALDAAAQELRRVL